MSAIWGAIQLNDDNISPILLEKMEKPFHEYKIDRYEKIEDSSVLMGCGIQYFNKQALEEKLPIIDGNIYFDADVVLDNREELLEKLCITDENTDTLSDGDILFKMLNKFGDECLDDILGAYVFVYYDKNSNNVQLVCDAVSNRTLYYKVKDNILYYSSLLEGINEASPSEISDEWCVDFLSMDFARAYADEEQTPYCGVYKVPSATQVIITRDSIKKNRYWTPLKNLKTKKYRDDNEVEYEFKKIWKEAVRCVMRTEDEVSILLSGGLDSTAVASEASPYLKEKGKNLYSFTSVPIDEHDSDRGARIDDETEDVLKSAEYYGNIVPEFLKLEGTNSWKGYDNQMKILEMPYKASLNALWMQEACLRARNKGARILLTGGYGNNCLSYSGIPRYCNYLFKKLHWIKLYKLLSDYKGTIGLSRKEAYKNIFKDAFVKNKMPENLFGKSFVNRTYANKLGAEERLRNIYRISINSETDYRARYDVMLDWIGMRQIGELTMKMSLYSGVLIRDPSIDKRLIEFCLQLPCEQFDKDGIDRHLVKYYLRNQIPAHVNRFVGRGRQSADMKLRIELDWDNIYNQWILLYRKNENNNIIDVKKALEELSDKDSINSFGVDDINRHIYTLKLLEFYNYHKVVTILDR